MMYMSNDLFFTIFHMSNLKLSRLSCTALNVSNSLYLKSLTSASLVLGRKQLNNKILFSQVINLQYKCDSVSWKESANN